MYPAMFGGTVGCILIFVGIVLMLSGGRSSKSLEEWGVVIFFIGLVFWMAGL